MKSRLTLVLWALIVLAVAYFRPFTKAPAAGGGTPSEVYAIDLAARAVTRLTVERGARRAEYRVVGDHWEEAPAEDGPGGRSDLAERLVSMITAGQQAVEVVAAAPTREQLEAFGLSPAATRVVVGTADGKQITLEVGLPSPSQLAFYARNDLRPAVVLVGFNVGYYIDLALEEAAKTARPRTAGAGADAATTRGEPSSGAHGRRDAVATRAPGPETRGQSIGDLGAAGQYAAES